MDTINQNLIKAKYEVRGGIVLKAEQMKKEMDTGKKMPFNDFVYWNIGNPQNLGQLPISFSQTDKKGPTSSKSFSSGWDDQ